MNIFLRYLLPACLALSASVKAETDFVWYELNPRLKKASQLLETPSIQNLIELHKDLSIKEWAEILTNRDGGMSKAIPLDGQILEQFLVYIRDTTQDPQLLKFTTQIHAQSLQARRALIADAFLENQPERLSLVDVAEGLLDSSVDVRHAALTLLSQNHSDALATLLIMLYNNALFLPLKDLEVKRIDSWKDSCLEVIFALKSTSLSLALLEFARQNELGDKIQNRVAGLIARKQEGSKKLASLP
jgi:hypothetical protein